MSRNNSIAYLTIATALCTIAGCSSQQAPREVKAAPSVVSATQSAEMGTQAKIVCQAIEQRMANGEPMTAANLEVYRIWSLRWAQSDRDRAATQALRVSAMTAHLQRMQTLAEHFLHVTDSTSWGVATARYYLLEARSLVDQAGR